MNKEIHDALVRIETIERDNSIRNTDSSNIVERALCGQLMLISTVFLTISVVAISNNDIADKLEYGDRLLVIITFITIVLSIACGIKYYFTLIKAHYEWARLHHENYVEFRDSILGTKDLNIKKVNDNVPKLSEPNDNSWLRRQIFLIGIAAFGCVLILASFLSV